MRISSIALSTLTALVAGEIYHPVQAAVTSPIALPTDDGSVASPLSAVVPPVGVQPETVMQPEFSRDRGLVKQTPANIETQPQSVSIHQSAAKVALAPLAEPAIAGDVLMRENSSTPANPDEMVIPVAARRDAISISTLNGRPDRGDSSSKVAQIPAPPNPAPIEQFPAVDKPAPLNAEDMQSELGEIKILNRSPETSPPRQQPDVQLLLRSGAFTSSNTTALKDFRNSDTIFINSALLLATPKLGPDTRLIASVGGGLLRFANSGDANYNTLSFSGAVQQRLAAGTYGQLGWAQDNLYRPGGGQRLLRDNSVQFLLGRQDQLAQQLRLDSFYELKASFTQPDEQSRVANTLGARLRYDVTPKLQGALDYRLTFKSFTQVDRADTEHQISALAIYNLSPDLFLAGSVSYLFGRSSNPTVDVRNFAIGISLGFNLPLF